VRWEGRSWGAGGGGFLLLLCHDGAVRRVRETVAGLGFRQMGFAFDLEGAKVLLDV